MRTHRCRDARGFTLIEVLVVVAIIAVLAGITFSIVSPARRAAKKTTCLSNLHQLGTAAALYMADYDALPPTNPLWYPAQKQLDDPLRAYGVTDEVCQCPEFDGKRQDPHVADYFYRFAIAFQRGDFMMVNWRVIPESGSVIVYCPWHLKRGDSPNVLKPEGTYNILRLDGSVKAIPAGAVKNHEEDWGEFGPDVPPEFYDWLQFPGEPFPPALDKREN